MTPQEYKMVCDRILTATLQQVDPANFTGYALRLHSTDVPNAIHASAVTDQAPITLVYTPAGTRKSKLVRDRAAALVASGMAPCDVTVLNMNIAKTNQMAADLPGFNVMTFNDFIEGLFLANFHGIEPSDSQSVLASVKLLRRTPETEELVRKLSIRNPQEQAVMTTLYVNEKADQVLETVRLIRKADSQLQSLLCQNYDLPEDPYRTKAIIVNGVHNMPLPVLCCILSYANKHCCNLFLTGSPKETIYEFNMAHGGAMDTLSGWDTSHVHVIHLLDRDAISDGVQSVLEMNEHAFAGSDEVSFEYHVNAKHFGTKAVFDALVQPGSWLSERVSSKTPVLVVANSKADLAAVKRNILGAYLPSNPDLRVVDLTTVQHKMTPYGITLTNNVDALSAAHPEGTTVWQLMADLYDILMHQADGTENEAFKQASIDAARGLKDWYQDRDHRFGDVSAVRNVRTLIQYFIEVESEDNQSYLKSMRGNAVVDTSDADIVLSTVHSAIDLRMDDVLAVVHQFGNRADMNLLRVALSRAGQSEHLVFIDDSKSDNPYPRYLKTHIKET